MQVECDIPMSIHIHIHARLLLTSIPYLADLEHQRIIVICPNEDAKT